MRELTLCILKPTLVKNPVALKCVHNIIYSENFRSVINRKLVLNTEQAYEFYNCHKGKFFFDRLITSMCSGPIIAHVLEAENAISKWRELMGPTKVYRAIYSNPYSIRGMFGLTDTRNATHGSDSPESAAKEIKFFFPEFSISDWCKENIVEISMLHERVS